MELLKSILEIDKKYKNISDSFLDIMKQDGVVVGTDIVGNISGAIIDCIPGIKISILSEINLQCVKVVDVYKDGCRCVCLGGIENNLTCGDIISFKFKRSSVLSTVSYVNRLQKTCDLFISQLSKKIVKGTCGYFQKDIIPFGKDMFLARYLKEELSNYVAINCLRLLSLYNKENKIPSKVFTVLTPDYNSLVIPALYKIQPVVSIILSTISLNDIDAKSSNILNIRKGPIVSSSRVNNSFLLKVFTDTGEELNVGSQVDYSELLVNNSEGIRVINGGIATLEVGIPVFRYGNSSIFSFSSLDATSKIVSNMCLRIPTISSFV